MDFGQVAVVVGAGGVQGSTALGLVATATANIASFIWHGLIASLPATRHEQRKRTQRLHVGVYFMPPTHLPTLYALSSSTTGAHFAMGFH
jgi:hypothetical protein